MTFYILLTICFGKIPIYLQRNKKCLRLLAAANFLLSDNEIYKYLLLSCVYMYVCTYYYK